MKKIGAPRCVPGGRGGGDGVGGAAGGVVELHHVEDGEDCGGESEISLRRITSNCFRDDILKQNLFLRK